MKFIFDDGGRSRAGYKGHAGDCVARAVAIASGEPYTAIYKAIAHGEGSTRKSRGASARNGVFTQRKWFKKYMRSLGFTWTPTMHIGSGCTVHLTDNELPLGRLVVSVSRHYTAVIDQVIHDTHDPQREETWHWADGRTTVSRRCVYGYWTLNAKQEAPANG